MIFKNLSTLISYPAIAGTFPFLGLIGLSGKGDLILPVGHSQFLHQSDSSLGPDVERN